MEEHDPGCKSKWLLPFGTTGKAIFRGDHNEHRLLLERRFASGLLTERDPEQFSLWIGMNPSGALADINDLTIHKESRWTQETFLRRRYVKMNIGTYRWTNSRTLQTQSRNLIHPENFDLLLQMAAKASEIIFTTGNPPEPLQEAAKTILDACVVYQHKRNCLGFTAQGWPRHSSRLAYSTPFQSF